MVFVLESEHGGDSRVAYIQVTKDFTVLCSNWVFGAAGEGVAAFAVPKTEHCRSLPRSIPDVSSKQLLAAVKRRSDGLVHLYVVGTSQGASCQQLKKSCFGPP
jgi:protein gp37